MKHAIAALSHVETQSTEDDLYVLLRFLAALLNKPDGI
jgi:hypothetical protein